MQRARPGPRLLARVALAWALTAASIAPSVAQTPSGEKIGIVVMHGKGGSPARHVVELATGLE